MQAYNSTMRTYFCIGFIGFMLKGKSLLEYTHYFLLMNIKRTTNWYLDVSLMKIYFNVCNKYRKFKYPEILYLF